MDIGREGGKKSKECLRCVCNGAQVIRWGIVLVNKGSEGWVRGDFGLDFFGGMDFSGGMGGGR